VTLNSKKWPLVLGAILLLPATLILARKPVLSSLGNFLIVKEDYLQPADLIHVLGGGVERLDYAVALYRQGYSPRLFITGGQSAVLYKTYAISQGAHPADIQPAKSWAMSTYQEALELKRYVDNEPTIQSVIIVSSPYHMRRAQWSFTQVLGNRVKLQFAPVPFAQSRHQERWWMAAGTRKSVITEYLKLKFYCARYLCFR